MQLPKSNLSELQLLRKEIETLADDFDRERLELRGEIDQLKLVIASMKAALREVLPAFDDSLRKAYVYELHHFNPEVGRDKKAA